MTTFELLQLFYDLQGGIAFNATALTATFINKESAIRFKAIAPSWAVQYKTFMGEA
jgi:hypothetical protein